MNTRYIAAEYRLAHWAEIIRKRVESGLCIRVFCNNTGINENAYFYWQRKLRESACEQLVKTQADSTSAALVHSGFTEVKLLETRPQIQHSEAALHGNISIEASGVKITANGGYPVDQLAYLLRELVR